MFFDQHSKYLEAPVYDRARLKAGNRIDGPAVIEEYDATTVLHPDWTAVVDKFANIILSTKKGKLD